MKKKIIKTEMMNRYLWKFLIRLVIFCIVFYYYLFDRKGFEQVVLMDLFQGRMDVLITPLHVLWLIFMLMMLSHLFPNRTLSMALKKRKKENYRENPQYSDYELLKFVQKQNITAWMVMLVWLLFHGMWGILYLMNLIDHTDLLMLTVFYFLCDYICILFFCPFQTYIMKNKCCVNCRIYDWGHFMMFTPMLFIRNFFSWSLFFTSLAVLIHWEIIYAKYPERFWHGSNQNLECKNCKDKTCQMKVTGRKNR